MIRAMRICSLLAAAVLTCMAVGYGAEPGKAGVDPSDARVAIQVELDAATAKFNGAVRSCFEREHDTADYKAALADFEAKHGAYEATQHGKNLKAKLDAGSASNLAKKKLADLDTDALGNDSVVVNAYIVQDDCKKKLKAIDDQIAEAKAAADAAYAAANPPPTDPSQVKGRPLAALDAITVGKTSRTDVAKLLESGGWTQGAYPTEDEYIEDGKTVHRVVIHVQTFQFDADITFVDGVVVEKHKR